MTRSRIIAVIAALVLVGGIGLYVAYDQVLRGDSAPPLAFPSASDAAGASSDPTPRRAPILPPARPRPRRVTSPGRGP